MRIKKTIDYFDNVIDIGTFLRTVPQVDATEEPDIAARYGVNGYPTLKWFVDGKALDFGGAREA